MYFKHFILPYLKLININDYFAKYIFYTINNVLYKYLINNINKSRKKFDNKIAAYIGNNLNQNNKA